MYRAIIVFCITLSRARSDDYVSDFPQSHNKLVRLLIKNAGASGGRGGNPSVRDSLRWKFACRPKSSAGLVPLTKYANIHLFSDICVCVCVCVLYQLISGLDTYLSNFFTVVMLL